MPCRTGPRRPKTWTKIAFDGNPVFLVVDDDPVNVRVIQNYFESRQCVVKTAPDGISALDIIDRDDSIDLVLLDIMMPVMSGYEVCRRIRVNRSPEELPVIMLTAKNMMADINAAFDAGANDYIVKPFRIQRAPGAGGHHAEAQERPEIGRRGHHHTRQEQGLFPQIQRDHPYHVAFKKYRDPYD